ncbi:malate synthase A [Pseudoclavibacter sp. 13-3]|uniref:malate synthase A n=1 Tax=Pseudoclavibacter sp. 13-3 TaxID=2901228 RepID=UPI001E42EAA6|nr:malate synthase A [Pseudoclavibacter sp. 13-3]MCD7102099.1 malate synthase A [Pseudoclavibacter sp. 13-3]
MHTTTAFRRPTRPVVRIAGPMHERFDEILTPEALGFLAALHHRFSSRRHELLAKRAKRLKDYSLGTNPDFLPGTAHIRSDRSWRVVGSEGAPGLQDRRVEITGPTDRKMTINALNSTAKVWLADFEDATSPTWQNVVGGQLSLFDAIRGEIDFTTPEGKQYALRTNELTELPTIVPRPRGWHLPEKHLVFTDDNNRTEDTSGSLVDFGLYFFHNANELIARGRGPYFYIPKLESHLEARLWNDVFSFAERTLGLETGTIRATVLIETLPAAFEIDEILYEMRDHITGINAGRWDYIFSVIKVFRERGAKNVLPDRACITMDVPFTRAYAQLLVQTAHARGAYAIGGMSAFIPNRRDPEVTERAFQKVSADKRREAEAGYDGTWVAHPDLIPYAQAEFDKVLGERPHQVDRQIDDVRIGQSDLLNFQATPGEVTEAGLRDNISVGIRYIESWLRGVGAAALDNLMEDAATAEISRTQIWQWLHYQTVTAEGETVTRGRVQQIIDDVVSQLQRFDGDRFDDAVQVFAQVALDKPFLPFLTTEAYRRYLATDVVAPELLPDEAASRAEPQPANRG